MRKATKTKPSTKSVDLRARYRFDYSKAAPNRFASRVPSKTVILLDPDVAKVFKDSDAVNTVLRAILAAVPRAN